MKYKIAFNPSRIFEVGYFIFLIAIATLAIINLTSKIPNKTPVKILSVVSGSMTPTIPVGSAIFVQKQAEYFNGDVVTYRLENNYVTHRVFYSGNYYLTKGDANKAVDQLPVQKDQIIGKVTLSTPYLGYLQESTKSLWGLVGFVYVPTLVVLLAESRLIISEIKKVQIRKIPLQSAFAILVGIFAISGVSLAYYSTTAFAFSANLTSVFPSPSTSPSPSPSLSPTPSASPTLTPSPTATPTVAPTATPTIAPTVTPTASPSLTPTPSGTPVPTVLPSACPTAGAVNCGNGAGSNNTVIIENNSTTIINQQNSSNSSTVITVNSQTGNNTGNGNSSNTQINTGNSNSSVYTGNIVNSNTVTQ